MGRPIRVRAKAKDPIDLERLARALLQAARELAAEADRPKPTPNEAGDD